MLLVKSNIMEEVKLIWDPLWNSYKIRLVYIEPLLPSKLTLDHFTDCLNFFNVQVFTDKNGDREEVNDVVIIFTNRIHASQLEDVLKKAHILKKNKVEIITVYFQHAKMPWNVKDELTAVASIPENVLTLQSSKKLRRTLKKRICPSVRAMRECF